MSDERRIDYPLCPYCGNKIYGFCPPDGDVRKVTLYCSSAECRGANLHGNMNGYDIKFTDLKVIYRVALPDATFGPLSAANEAAPRPDGDV